MPRQTPSGPSSQATHLTDIDVRQRRRVLARALAAVIALDLTLIGLYAWLPVDDARGWTPLVMFAGMVAIFAVVVALQIRGILGARYPAVRAAVAAAFLIPVYLVLWALAYLALATGNPDSFTEPLDRVASLYFTVTVFATVGFGDITAVTSATRVAVTLQMIMNLLVLGLVVKLLMGVARVTLSRSAPAAEGAAPEPASESGQLIPQSAAPMPTSTRKSGPAGPEKV